MVWPNIVTYIRQARTRRFSHILSNFCFFQMKTFLTNNLPQKRTFFKMKICQDLLFSIFIALCTTGKAKMQIAAAKKKSLNFTKWEDIWFGKQTEEKPNLHFWHLLTILLVIYFMQTAFYFQYTMNVYTETVVLAFSIKFVWRFSVLHS